MKYNHTNLLWTALIISITGAKTFAQDTRFTQAFSTPLKLNPAIIGGNDEMKFMLGNRKQWGNIGKGFNSVNATAIYPLYLESGKEKLNLGLNFLSDRAGAFKTTDISLSIGYGLRITDNSYLNCALQGGYAQQTLFATNLSFDE
ncbi:MAG: type IX secretion system membrane protein PorP/SprF, partial [Bacteroidia bacterium]|nr:type IX secretion system membrane protein PorP/SprF [Bacteroidia bacterium]